MKRFIALVFVFLAYTGIPAQEKAPDFGWKTSAIGKVNVTQSQFDNWSQGGENTLAWQGLFEATVTNEQERFLWKNYLKMSYGQNKIGSGSLKKTTDEIVLESVLNYKTGWTADAYLALTAKTQFSAGYLYPADAPAVEISNFLDPGYFTQEVGLSWNPPSNFLRGWVPRLRKQLPIGLLPGIRTIPPPLPLKKCVQNPAAVHRSCLTETSTPTFF